MRAFRAFVFAAVASAAFSWAALAAECPEVTLRAAPVVSGPVVTLGDLFEGAGAAAAEPIAPAPAPGTTAPLSVRFVAAAVDAAGLRWTPPPALDRIQVGRAVSGRAASARAIAAGGPTMSAGFSANSGETQRAALAVRRGDTIALVYDAPGVRITATAKALSEGAPGETIRVQNTQSNRIVDARVASMGVATAIGPAS
ncbi:MAG: flagellar basal body P-ring formation protein FlgA [Alphaproteobacteria bacterium]|nr:flagellar basal body P-ring formation protein FlgA [Alphaproteobacteria bacterium]